ARGDGPYARRRGRAAGHARGHAVVAGAHADQAEAPVSGGGGDGRLHVDGDGGAGGGAAVGEARAARERGALAEHQEEVAVLAGAEGDVDLRRAARRRLREHVELAARHGVEGEGAVGGGAHGGRLVGEIAGRAID